MKKIYSFFVFTALATIACSEFDERLEGDFLNANEAAISDFNTDFPLINIRVNQEEFDTMYSKYADGIEIEAFLNLYRNNVLLISDELIEIEIKGTTSATFGLKSLGIKFDTTFDNKEYVLINPERILPHHSIENIKSLRLRNSGNFRRQFAFI